MVSCGRGRRERACAARADGDLTVAQRPEVELLGGLRSSARRPEVELLGEVTLRRAPGGGCRCDTGFEVILGGCQRCGGVMSSPRRTRWLRLDVAARRWPGEANRRRLLHEGRRVVAEEGCQRGDSRRAAVARTAGALSGVYGEGYLATLRGDWPECRSWTRAS